MNGDSRSNFYAAQPAHQHLQSICSYFCCLLCIPTIILRLPASLEFRLQPLKNTISSHFALHPYFLEKLISRSYSLL